MPFFQSRYRVFGYQPVPSTDVKPVCLSINLTCGFFHIAGNLAQNNVNTGLGDVSIYYYLLNFFNHEQTSVRPPRNSSACSPGLWTVSTQCAVNLRKNLITKLYRKWQRVVRLYFMSVVLPALRYSAYVDMKD